MLQSHWWPCSRLISTLCVQVGLQCVAIDRPSKTCWTFTLGQILPTQKCKQVALLHLWLSNWSVWEAGEREGKQACRYRHTRGAKLCLRTNWNIALGTVEVIFALYVISSQKQERWQVVTTGIMSTICHHSEQNCWQLTPLGVKKPTKMQVKAPRQLFTPIKTNVTSFMRKED